MNSSLAFGLALAVTAAVPARAETLADAVRWAMASNPQLAAARDRQEALAETPEQARSGGRLTAETDANAGYDRFGYGRGATVSVSAALPIWTGGRVSSAVRATTRDVDVGEQLLRDTVADVIAQVVGAYADMLFQQQAVSIGRADIDLLDSQVAEARARFDLGTGTQTDVARLVAQREQAAGTLASAQATLAAATATYCAVIGHEPGKLAPAADDFLTLPASLDEARQRSVAANPAYLSTLAAQGAADARIGVARANGAPAVTLGGNYGYSLAIGREASGYVAGATAGVTLRVPILTGGLVASQVRQAGANARAASHDTDRAGREAVRSTDTAWANVAAARLRVAAGERGVAAAERALAGVKAEYAVALRTTLDILIADESLRGAQLTLAASRADLLTGEATLLRAVGSLEPAVVSPTKS